jgi:hypothetical protein
VTCAVARGIRPHRAHDRDAIAAALDCGGKLLAFLSSQGAREGVGPRVGLGEQLARGTGICDV